MARQTHPGRHRPGLSSARAAAAVVVTLLAGTVLLPTALPVAAADLRQVCVPVAARFQDSWETVDAASGQVTRRFGTLAWTRSGVDYDIRNGFAVEICTASVDAEAGYTFTSAGAQVRGPDIGRLPFPDLTGLGFGYVTVSKAARPERLPATGASALGGPLAAALVLLTAGAAMMWHTERHRRQRPGLASRGGRAQ